MIMKIFITEDKKDEMSGLCEKMLHYGGKLMSCIEALEAEGYGERVGMRENDWDEDEDDDEPVGMRGVAGAYGSRAGMRRGRSVRTGRYTRY